MKKAEVLWVVAAALISADGKILVQKRAANRAMAGLWEFPGGKVEEGEPPEVALVRELKEELGIKVEVADLAPLSFASEPLDEKHLLLLLYVCRKWTGEPSALDADALQWADVEALALLPMPPADVPLVKALMASKLAAPNLS